MTKKFFSDCDKLITRVQHILEKQFTELNSNFYGSSQKASDLKQNLIRYKGFYVPASHFDHKILFDGFEVNIVEMFIDFYKAIHGRKEKDVFAEFSLRTLSEISFKKIQLLFTNETTTREKNRLKLLTLLADYAKLGIDNPKHQNTYNKLLNEFDDCLTIKQKSLCKDLIDNIKKKNSEAAYKLVRELRREINITQNNLFDKVGLLPIFRKEQLYVMFSEWSHLLHGNMFLLRDVFSNKRPAYRHKLRVYWNLILCGINAVNYIGKYSQSIDYSSELRKVNTMFRNIKKNLAKYWRVIENWSYQ